MADCLTVYRNVAAVDEESQVTDFRKQFVERLNPDRDRFHTLPRSGQAKVFRPAGCWVYRVSPDQEKEFRQWRRHWLPGFALVGRDDLLAQRLQDLRATTQPDATLLNAWLHAARFNYEPVAPDSGTPAVDGKVQWADPWRPKGSGWMVPIPVGYAALTPPHGPGTVRNARDTRVPLRFVESVYSLGEWISPHRLSHLDQLLWHAEAQAEVEAGAAPALYRCRNGYQPAQAGDAAKGAAPHPDMQDDWDDAEAYDYT